jgi:ABC-2 type transport system permease protein
MISLVRAELHRLRSRRLTLVMLLAVVLAAGLFQLAVNAAVTPPGAAELAAAQAQYERDLRDFEQHRDEYTAGVQECLDAGGDPQSCDPTPRLEWYAQPATPFSEIAPMALLFATLAAGLGAFVVAASFIGAEYTSGSIANWLTFIPQRALVFAAKAVAVLLGAGLAGTVVLGGSLAAAAGLTSLHGGRVTGLGPLAGTAARGVALVVAMALVGFGITLVARHTAAAIGVLVGYGLLSIALTIAYNFASGLQRVKPFLPDVNLQAFLNRGHSYTDVYQRMDVGGETADIVSRHISTTQGGLYWLTACVVVLGTAMLVFRRRDVT